jgi:hypothetical protein
VTAFEKAQEALLAAAATPSQVVANIERLSVLERIGVAIMMLPLMMILGRCAGGVRAPAEGRNRIALSERWTLEVPGPPILHECGIDGLVARGDRQAKPASLDGTRQGTIMRSSRLR